MCNKRGQISKILEKENEKKNAMVSNEEIV
jgi:hypothetical protein